MLKSRVLKKMLCMTLTFCTFFVTGEIYAETNISPSLGLMQEYNDNIFFTRENKVDDSITRVIPAIRLNYATELLNLSGLALWDSYFYWDNNDLNYTIQNYVLDGKYRLTERWDISGNAGYLKDTTLDSELEDTGVVGIRQDRERIDAGAETTYAVSERSSLGLGYDYRKINYQRPSSVDNELNRFRLTYNRRLANQIDVFSLFPEFTYGTSDQWDAYNYTLNFRWTHQFDPTLRSSFRIGPRFTQIDYKDERDDKNNWGGVLEAWIEKRGEVTVGRLNLSNRLQTRSNGEIVIVSRLLGDLDHRLTERLGIGFNGGLYYTRPIKELEPKEGDTWYYLLQPSLFYRLTENYLLRLLYSFDQEIQPDFDNQRRNRQRIWLRLDFDFPRLIEF
jgi:hypothetical protein